MSSEDVGEIPKVFSIATSKSVKHNNRTPTVVPKRAIFQLK